MNWVLFVLAFTGVTVLIGFVAYHYVYAKRFQKGFDDIWKVIRKNAEVVKKIRDQQEYDRELFDHHFKVTDNTIIEERKEKQYWKKKALALEKKVAKLK